MNNALDEYYRALGRLISTNPTVVPKGTKITNDAVSLEAGRSKGSIKRSRPAHADLITAIDAAALKQAKPSDAAKSRLELEKSLSEQYRSERDAALARELSLVRELYAVKKELAALTGGNVLPIRGGSR